MPDLPAYLTRKSGSYRRSESGAQKLVERMAAAPPSADRQAAPAPAAEPAPPDPAPNDPATPDPAPNNPAPKDLPPAAADRPRKEK